MPVIPSNINKNSPEFVDRYQAMSTLVDDLNQTLAAIQVGGSERARQKHQSRGKLLARDRIRLLLDRASPFLEVAPYAAYQMYDDNVPAAGIVTGIGSIQGRECMIFAN
ncbi:MAG: methylcrotonoyl-CoA carboxylase, partial [Gammaproteobacteria bacterium]|nr:methylcrotonoyl-CoA carboxylase [Gammaproteobacteria bacterium]